ncbi:uncharacterized protein LOC141873635 [Acropora palmata]|uniref:uncharacterized protein LOC141873635 n=1 Tax=Acropora palmata TaxID=6131 RepID=UPI003DA19958
MANQDKVDLFDAFGSSDAFKKVFEKLLNQAEPTVALLALGGLFRIEGEVGRGQFSFNKERIRSFLRRWRNDNDSGYERITKKVLTELTIFKIHEVPLFIDDYGKKNLLSNYDETVEVVIHLDQTIYHVTHFEEAMSIANSMELRASDNKNIMSGCWFGLESPESVYGSRAFKTTLSKLGVGGLRQGEIVFYKQEVNVILYADNEGDSDGVKKPTDKDAWRYHKNPHMYVKVSIFVPKRFLPKPDDFNEVIRGPFRVKHDPFCVRAKRTQKPCFELFYEDVMEIVRCNEDPVTIIAKINSRSGVTREKTTRAVVNLFLELCLPDSSLSEEDQSNNLKMGTTRLLPVISEYVGVFGNRSDVLRAIEAWTNP